MQYFVHFQISSPEGRSEFVSKFEPESELGLVTFEVPGNGGGSGSRFDQRAEDRAEGLSTMRKGAITPKMAKHAKLRSCESKSERAGRSAGRSAIQIDNWSFGGRSNRLGSIPVSERGGTATIDNVRPRCALPAAIGMTAAKW
jgi:hypothetical protein